MLGLLLKVIDGVGVSFIILSNYLKLIELVWELVNFLELDEEESSSGGSFWEISSGVVKFIDLRVVVREKMVKVGVWLSEKIVFVIIDLVLNLYWVICYECCFWYDKCINYVVEI